MSHLLAVWLEWNIRLFKSCHIKILFVCLFVCVLKENIVFHWHNFLKESADAYLGAFQPDSVGKWETWTLSICNCVFQFCSFVFIFCLHWPEVNRLTGNTCCKKEILPFPAHFPLCWLPGFFVNVLIGSILLTSLWFQTWDFLFLLNLHLLGNTD